MRRFPLDVARLHASKLETDPRVDAFSSQQIENGG